MTSIVILHILIQIMMDISHNQRITTWNKLRMKQLLFSNRLRRGCLDYQIHVFIIIFQLKLIKFYRITRFDI